MPENDLPAEPLDSCFRRNDGLELRGSLYHKCQHPLALSRRERERLKGPDSAASARLESVMLAQVCRMSLYQQSFPAVLSESG